MPGSGEPAGRQQPPAASHDPRATLSDFDTRFNLLVIGQRAPAVGLPGLGDLLSAHAIPDDPANAKELARVGISGPAFYLLRPDGHVGLAGTRLDVDTVKRYLAEHHIHPNLGA